MATAYPGLCILYVSGPNALDSQRQTPLNPNGPPLYLESHDIARPFLVAMFNESRGRKGIPDLRDIPGRATVDPSARGRPREAFCWVRVR